MAHHLEVLDLDRTSHSSDQTLPDDLRQLVGFHIAKKRLRYLIEKQITDNATPTDIERV